MFKRWLTVLASCACALFVATFVVAAWRKTLAGHGADWYQNYRGMPVRVVDIIGLLGGAVFVVLVAFFIKWWQKRDDRLLDRLERQSRRMPTEHAPNKSLERARSDRVHTREGSA